MWVCVCVCVCVCVYQQFSQGITQVLYAMAVIEVAKPGQEAVTVTAFTIITFTITITIIDTITITVTSAQWRRFDGILLCFLLFRVFVLVVSKPKL